MTTSPTIDAERDCVNLNVADNATLGPLGTVAEVKLRLRFQEISGEAPEARCEARLIGSLLINGTVTFAPELQEHLRVNADTAYVEAKKTFEAIWLRLAKLIAEA